MKKIAIISLVALLTGCAGANISSQMRSSSVNTSMMTRCLNVSTGSESSMNNELADYDGWNLIYMSEYTTANKASTAAVMCFEKLL